MNKHTPGPWNLHPAYTDPELLAVPMEPFPFVACNTFVARGQKIIADVQMKARTVGGYPTVKTKDEMMANARLISAAPELLEALEECRKLLEYLPEQYVDKDDGHSITYSPDGALAMARAAIAKARGQG